MKRPPRRPVPDSPTPLVPPANETEADPPGDCSGGVYFSLDVRDLAEFFGGPRLRAVPAVAPAVRRNPVAVQPAVPAAPREDEADHEDTALDENDPGGAR